MAFIKLLLVKIDIESVNAIQQKCNAFRLL